MIYKGTKKDKTYSKHAGPVDTTPEKFENATITGYFGFVTEEDSAREIT